MSIEKEPKKKAPWPPEPSNDKFYRWPKPYRVGQEGGESWFTIAKKFGIDAKDLVSYNFRTNDPNEINWYLANYVGAPAPRSGEKYYSFFGAKYDESKKTGVIFIPWYGVPSADYGNRWGNQIVSNYSESKLKASHGLCYEVVYKRVREAAAQVNARLPIFDNTSDFSRIWGSLIAPKRSWLALPEEYRGMGAAGALAYWGLGTLVDKDGVWGGQLKPGAVMQLWEVSSDFDRAKRGDPVVASGHSIIFLNYVYAGAAVKALTYADQGSGLRYTLERGDYAYWVGCNLTWGGRAPNEVRYGPNP